MQVDDEAAAMRRPRLLQVDRMTKAFPGVVALRDATFELRAGEVHVLFGENGAGKSTLVNIISGILRPDSGTMRFRGEEIVHHSPRDARARGISMVSQHLSLVPALSVEENLLLGSEPTRGGVLDRRQRRAAATEALNAVLAPFPVTSIVGRLPRWGQQLVEIARAVKDKCPVLILDEPTTSLAGPEIERLFELIHQMRASGLAIIYITHRMEEIEALADRVTVMRNGETVATKAANGLDRDQLVQMLTGRKLETLYPKARAKPGQVRLSMRGVFSSDLRDVSLTVHGGEVVGIAGLVGSSKSQIGRVCYGLDRRTKGTIEICGCPIQRRPKPRELLTTGVMYYPGDRHLEGLIMSRSVRDNLMLSALDQRAFSARGGILKRGAERQAVARVIEQLRVHPPDAQRLARQLSGGNQQKLVVGRALTRPVRLHIFNEPTSGVDVGARVEVYSFIKEMCERGDAILLISSDLSEIVHISHRVYVVHQGQIQAELEETEISEQGVLANFFVEQAATGVDPTRHAEHT